MQLISVLFLALGLANSARAASLDQLLSAYTIEHTPEEEAELISNARQEEINFRKLWQGKNTTRMDLSSLAAAASVSCRYVSGISTPPPKMRVALTFDDGPDPSGTPYVLEVLAKYRIQATFFMTGAHASAYPDLVKRVIDAGHLVVGNHSWNHPDFHTLDASQQNKQVVATRDVLKQYQEQKFFRYPFGNSTCYGNDLVHSLGYKIVGWHVDSCDWGFNATGQVSAKNAQICEVRADNMDNFVGHVVQQVQAHRGGIVLMHDIQPNTIRQLDRIVEELSREGFSFGMLDEAGFQPSLR